jgi:hypothetical protein
MKTTTMLIPSGALEEGARVWKTVSKSTLCLDPGPLWFARTGADDEKQIGTTYRASLMPNYIGISLPDAHVARDNKELTRGRERRSCAASEPSERPTGVLFFLR